MNGAMKQPGISHRLVAAWLRHCIDPLGLRPNPPRSFLSPQQTRKLLLKADAHYVLPIALRNFPFPAQDPEFGEVREEANARRIAGLALSTMLNCHAEQILAAAQSLPVAIVKGRTFARSIYPSAALRPFTDIDLLARPEAISQIDSVLLAQGFTRVEEGLSPARLETKWVHSGTGGLVEVHTNLVHSSRMRRAFSLAYDDLGGHAQTPGALLAVAIVHGTVHYFAWLRHVVDICQAARAVTTDEEEARFEALTTRTGTRSAAIVGLTLAYRLLGEVRCLEIAKALGSVRHAWLAKFLTRSADLTATSNNWLLYNSWRRYIFRELIRYGALNQ
jgi:hypothetical protein